MFPQIRKYYIIIVHYGPSAQVAQAMKALRGGSRTAEHILVVNHAQQAIVGDYQGASIIHPQENGGYAAGVNSGLRALAIKDISARDIVIVMNSDVVVRHDTLATLQAWWKKYPNKALVGGRVKEGQEDVIGLRYVNLVTGRTRSSSSTLTSESFWRIQYIHGAFFSAPYEVLLQVGGMPERYFLYCEDVLLSMQVQRHGIPLRIASDVVVDHHTRHNNTHKEQQLYYLVRNGAILLEGHAPQPWRVYWWVYNRARLLYHTLRPQGSAIVRQALHDAVRRYTGKNTEL